MNNNAPKTTTAGWVATFSAAAVAASAFYADLHNLPGIAAAMDWGTGRLYGWVPLLNRLPYLAWFAIGALWVGACFFVVASALAAWVFPGHSSRDSRGEVQLKKRGNKKAHRAVHIRLEP
jgi:hypothetical protein